MIRPDPPPFDKYDPDGKERERRTAASLITRGLEPQAADEAARRKTRASGGDRLAAKKWILRWGWAVATGMLIAGYVVAALALTGRLPGR